MIQYYLNFLTIIKRMKSACDVFEIRPPLRSFPSVRVLPSFLEAQRVSEASVTLPRADQRDKPVGNSAL